MAFTGPDAFTVIIFLTDFRNGDALPGEKFAEEVNIEHQTFPTVSKYPEILILNFSMGGKS